MEKIHKKIDPNEIPIIFVRDVNGHTPTKVSVKEWTDRYSPVSLNELQIKLYRQALAYYSEKDYAKAIDLLKFLSIANLIPLPSGLIKKLERRMNTVKKMLDKE